MTNRVRIRCWHEGDETRRELVVGETVVTEISFIETLEFVMQATSTLRHDGSKERRATQESRRVART